MSNIIFDISSYQKSMRLRDNKGVVGYIFRGAIGSSYYDKNVLEFLTQAKEIQVPFGFYTAAYAKNIEEAIGEANYICDLADNYDVDLPIFYDFEYFSSDYILKTFGVQTTPRLVQDLTKAYCDTIIARGYKTGVYTNKDYYDRFYGKAFFDNNLNYAFWYARPGLSKPDKQCDLWQYASNNGSEFNYNANVDKNVLYANWLENEGNKPPVEIEKQEPLSKESCRLYIGFASAGDIKKIATNVEGLGITAAVADGYIITGLCSAGDQCYILVDCNALGVPCVIYKEPEKPTEPSEPTQPVDPPQEEPKPEEPAPVPKPEDPTDGQEKTLMEVIKKIVKILYEFFYGE